MRCGTDICDVNRMKDTIERLGDSFLNRVFSKDEITYCESKKTRKYESYSARFAGKEAVFKAIGQKKDEDGVFTEVEILKEESGRPYVVLHGQLKEIAGNVNIDISLSHEKDYAIAMCVID